MRNNRSFNEPRKLDLIPNFNRYAEGSFLIKLGNTQVICTASIEERVPHWLKNKGLGWITAEYGMLPRSTHSRMEREAIKGKQSGRSSEIQRLIGRSLRSIVRLEKIPEKQIKVDCDVIQADGGTRTASINGGFVALAIALKKYQSVYNISENIIKEHIAAISCGIINGEENLDLDYEEDSKADVDANFVITESENIVEIQSTTEKSNFTEKQFLNMMNLAKNEIKQIILLQKKVLNDIEQI